MSQNPRDSRPKSVEEIADLRRGRVGVADAPPLGSGIVEAGRRPVVESSGRDLDGILHPSILMGTKIDFTTHEAKSSLFYVMCQATRMPMVVTDPDLPDNPIVYGNEAFNRLTGFGDDEYIGRNCRFLQGPETSTEAVSLIRQAIRDGRSIDAVLLNYRKDGSQFWNNLYINPLRGPDGKILYYFASQWDISGHFEAEEAKRRQNYLEAIGQLTGGIAHDFNNLLQVIGGYSELLLMHYETKSAEDMARVISQACPAIYESSLKAAELTSQLLTFARRQRLDQAVISLGAVVRGFEGFVSRTMTPAAEGNAIGLELNLAPANDSILVDRVQLERVLLNVMINARDAMPNGGKIKINTSIQRLDENLAKRIQVVPGVYVCLEVRDTGIGIPHEIVNKVTEPFFTTKEAGKGSGLGLSTALGFAQQSGGALRVASTLGQGTTITLYFPQQEESAING